ncbi:hypothetical protein Lal_00042605 [Lupinus albus]|nr:hypothetical protein Lal_00042605 [Lupinus albus]
MQNMQFQQETRASIQETRSSISESDHTNGTDGYFIEHIAITNSDKLPSQTVINPKNVSAITLRSGKQTELATSKRNSTLPKVDDIGRHIHASTPSSSHIWHQGHFGHYKWMMCAKVKIIHTIKTGKPPFVCVSTSKEWGEYEYYDMVIVMGGDYSVLDADGEGPRLERLLYDDLEEECVVLNGGDYSVLDAAGEGPRIE